MTIIFYILGIGGLLCILNKANQINRKINKMAESQIQLADDLNKLSDQIKKIGTETSATLQKVSDLEAALASAGNVTPEVQAALDALKVQAQATDDLVPDAPAPVEAAPEAPAAPDQSA